MKTYAKGAKAERELLHFLNSKGFSCMRAASSGGWISPMDVIALKKGLIVAFECKSYKNKPRLERKKLQRFKEWCEKAGAMGFLAWYSQNSWKFLPIKDAEENRYENDYWLAHENLLSVIDL